MFLEVSMPCSKVCYDTADALPPSNYFNIHLHQIQSPWTWRRYATLKCQNKPLLCDAKPPKQPSLEEQPSWKPKGLQGVEKAGTQWSRCFSPLCKPCAPENMAVETDISFCNVNICAVFWHNAGLQQQRTNISNKNSTTQEHHCIWQLPITCNSHMTASRAQLATILICHVLGSISLNSMHCNKYHS